MTSLFDPHYSTSHHPKEQEIDGEGTIKSICEILVIYPWYNGDNGTVPSIILLHHTEQIHK